MGHASEVSSESETVELHSEPPEPVPARQPSGFWRELSGALAYGLCALAVVVVGFQIVAWLRGNPGPGWFPLAGHVLTAAIAVGAQRIADRYRGWQSRAAVLGVLVVGGLALWIFWWA